MPVTISNPVTDEQCAEIYRIGKSKAEASGGGEVTTITQNWLNPTNPMYPTWPSAETLVIEIAIPANAIWGDFLVSWGEHSGPPVHRRVTLSATPNDFRPVDKSGANGPFVESGGPRGGVGGKLSNKPPLQAGKTFYANFRNEFKDQSTGQWVPSTDAAEAEMIVGWTFPK